MRPLTVITAILLGSSLAIAVSLAAVLFVFIVLHEDYPRLNHEFRPLTISFLIFLGMTMITAASFYALVKRHPLRRWSQILVWCAFAATCWYYWP